MEEHLNYICVGSGNTNLVFLHGLAADSGFWLPLISLFDKSRYTIHLLDLKGHGKSTFNNLSCLPSLLSKEVSSLLSEKNLTSFSLVGHSFGGRVALNLLNAMPSINIRSIFILDTYWPEFQERPSIKNVASRSKGNNDQSLMSDENDPISATQAFQLMRSRMKSTDHKIKKKNRTNNLATWEKIISDNELSPILDKEIDELVECELIKPFAKKTKLIYGSDSLFLSSGIDASKYFNMKLTVLPMARHFFPRHQAVETADLIRQTIEQSDLDETQ